MDYQTMKLASLLADRCTRRRGYTIRLSRKLFYACLLFAVPALVTVICVLKFVFGVDIGLTFQRVSVVAVAIAVLIFGILCRLPAMKLQGVVITLESVNQKLASQEMKLGHRRPEDGVFFSCGQTVQRDFWTGDPISAAGASVNFGRHPDDLDVPMFRIRSSKKTHELIFGDQWLRLKDVAVVAFMAGPEFPKPPG